MWSEYRMAAPERPLPAVRATDKHGRASGAFTLLDVRAIRRETHCAAGTFLIGTRT
jgi:hypothetical protein